MLGVSTTASQGSRSLAVASHGYVPVQSVALTSLGSRVGSVIHYDIMLPSQLRQISPNNYGATQLYLNSTSLGLNNTYLGQVELTPLPLGQWNTLTFTPSSSVLTKLRGTYTDLQVTIVVNAPYNATQPYLLDNLRFSDSTLALVTVVDGGGHPLSGLTVTAYNGSTVTSDTGVTDSTGLAKVWVPPGSYRFGVTEAGVTTYSSATNQCQVPGICDAATIVAKCHGVVCTAKDTCHNAGTCDPTTGACSNPAKPAGTVCRSAAGPCDVAEACDGTASGCPADAFAPATTVCRASAGPCDVAEACTGTNAACPAEAFAPATTVCRASAGPCDLAELPAAACPAAFSLPGPPPAPTWPRLAPVRTRLAPLMGFCRLRWCVVRRLASATWPRSCTGTAAACPPDGLASASTVCRASTGACDPAETCTGSSPTCPTDVTAGAPPVPSGLAAMGGNGQVSLTWTASSGATSYNVKRGTTSGGPYGTVFPSASPSYTDTGVTNGTAYYYVVTAVSNCGESANSSEVPGAPFTPIPPRSLPRPPSDEGCYWYTANGWETIPCEPVSDVIQLAGHPAIPPSLALPYVEVTPNPDSSPKPVLVPAPGSAHTPYVFGQLDIMFPVFGGETDAPTIPNPDPALCPTTPTIANRWSVQLNTNKFLMTNGHNGAIQFSLDALGPGTGSHICAWQVDATTQDYDSTSICVETPPMRSTGLQPFDFVSIAGSVDVAKGTLGIVVQLSWIDPGQPNIYSRVGTDKYGLGANWITMDGAVLGLGNCSQAQFTETSVVTRLMASSCPGVTSPTSNTSGCPTPTLQPNVSFENRTATAETNNLIQDRCSFGELSQSLPCGDERDRHHLGRLYRPEAHLRAGLRLGQRRSSIERSGAGILGKPRQSPGSQRHAGGPEFYTRAVTDHG